MYSILLIFWKLVISGRANCVKHEKFLFFFSSDIQILTHFLLFFSLFQN